MTKTREQAPAASRHIIERPRLTRLLDETTARVIMLIAPAGYGKTTLARQWLATRPHVWYVASPVSAGFAALGNGLTQAAADVAPNVGHRLREWLHARRAGGEPSVAADLLAHDLREWPSDMWLAIDDYHCLAPEAEDVVQRLRNIDTLRLIVTSRRKPRWSTPREVLYGDLYELGPAALAMTEAEADEVLRGLDEMTARELIFLARGWPAIIGLAAFSEGSLPLESDFLPPALHSYIADELYALLEPAAREGLAELSLVQSVSAADARHLLGPEGDLVLAEGTRVGFFTEATRGRYSAHPLLRSFLRVKLNDLSSERLDVVIADAVKLLITNHEWENAFEAIQWFGATWLLDELIKASIYDLLDQGLIETVSQFVAFGRARGHVTPFIDLAEAELLFRVGFHDRSRTLAEAAGRRLQRDRRFAAKAFCRAGQCAYFCDDLDGAVANFNHARDLADDVADERGAVWGLFLSAVEREDRAAEGFLSDFEIASGTEVDDLLRMQNGRLHLGMRIGSLSASLSGAAAVASVVSQARDPVVRTSFWHVYAGALRVAGDYAGALAASDRALDEITTFDLDFARAHVYLTRAGVYTGIGAYGDALTLLDQAAEIGQQNGDTYLQMSERTLRCRAHLLDGDLQSAVRATDLAGDITSSGQHAEFLACRALILAMTGVDTKDALEVLSQAEARSSENEASCLCACVRSLLILDQDASSAKEAITGGFSSGVAKRIIDPFVFAFRLERRLVGIVSRVPALRNPITEVLAIVDQPIRQPEGVLMAPMTRRLTKREAEVFALVAQGKTNKEIASILFLTESTVKVHVRHILRKLGARTRTEAAIQAVKMQQHADAATQVEVVDPGPHGSQT